MAGNNLVAGTTIGELSADGAFEWDGISWNSRRLNLDNPIVPNYTLGDVVTGNLPSAPVGQSSTGTGRVQVGTDNNSMPIYQNVTWIRYNFAGSNNYFRVINEVTGVSRLERSQPMARP